MSTELKISPTLSLPIDAATQTIAIVARKRVGKTYTASVIAAWGAFPCAIERAKSVRGMFAGKLYHLGLTQAGHPKHPLYIKKETQPTLWH